MRSPWGHRGNLRARTAGAGRRLIAALGLSLFLLSPAAAWAPSPNPGAWTSPADWALSPARYGHTTTRLPDGRLLVIGGCSSSGYQALNTAVVFDPQNPAAGWQAAGVLNNARVGHTATLLDCGLVLVVGGVSDVRGLYPVTSAELWDPTGARLGSAGFHATDAPSVPRYQHTATRLTGGEVLVLGGIDPVGKQFAYCSDGWLQALSGVADVETYVFDDITNTGTFQPTDWLLAGCSRHTATLLPDGTVLVVGGTTTGLIPDPLLLELLPVPGGPGPFPTDTYFSSAVWRFDPGQPAGSRWSAMTGLPAPRVGHTATALPGGKVLIAGGFDGSAVTRVEASANPPYAFLRPVAGSELLGALIYDPAGGGSVTNTDPLPGVRSHHSATLLDDGRVLVAGGCSSAGAVSDELLFDPNDTSGAYGNGAWGTAAASGQPRYLHTATLLVDGRVAALGGLDGGSQAVAAAALFDPSNTPADPTNPVTVSTGGGSSVPGGAEFTFESVSATGNTTVTETADGPPPPSNFQIASVSQQGSASLLYYEIQTTATFSGVVTIAIGYDDTNLTPAEETKLELLHWNSVTQTWDVVTTSRNINLNILYGETSSFSPFVIMLSTNTPPVADAGPDQLVSAGPDGLAAVHLDGAGSTDTDGDELSYVWLGPFGVATGARPTVSMGLGTHVVNLTVSDGNGASASDTVTVTVIDTTAPVITRCTASPDTLGPPNHKMVPVTVTVESHDNCDPVPSCRIVAVSSNEPADGTGDGHTAADWEITGTHSVRLRAERAGTGTGRVYTITVECRDAAGNRSTATVAVRVGTGTQHR